jgi:formylglycine-generating enzyme required for sulfatase activity
MLVPRCVTGPAVVLAGVMLTVATLASQSPKPKPKAKPKPPVSTRAPVARAPSPQLPPIKLPLGAKLVEVPAGTFEMGCVPNDRSCDADESPRRRVQLTRTYWMLATEVTVAQFRSYAAESGLRVFDQPRWSGQSHPIVNVTWNDAAAFCSWMQGRLPTEAEWERAARLRAPSDIWPTGAVWSPGAANGRTLGGSADAWEQTAPVGSFPAVAGLFDLAGNVWEWTADWYGREVSGGPLVNPAGPTAGLNRVVRGGAWSSPPALLRSSKRDGLAPAQRYEDVGFRCVADRPS